MPSLSSSHHSPAAGADETPTTSQPVSRPALTKRHHSSSSAQTLSRNAVTSPSGSEQSLAHHHPHAQPTRHAVGKRHAKFALARGHGSRGNLVKLGRHAAAQHHGEEAHARKAPVRSKSGHEGDTEIRLPGSLDETRQPPPPPPIRRNMTSYQLPRASSHVKLKKNHSHGALTRLNSSKAMSNHTSSGSQRTPLSPGIRGKGRRHRSDDLGAKEKDLHAQEVELLQQQLARDEPPKKVGFAVGSMGGESSNDEDPQMEGSGLQEDEWTEESASASPYSTRQNTANNSRRPSVVDHPTNKTEKPGGKHPFATAYAIQQAAQAKELKAKAKAEAEQEQSAIESSDEEDDDDDNDDDEEEVESSSDDESRSPRNTAPVHHHKKSSSVAQVPRKPAPIEQPKAQARNAATDHSNPATRRILSNNAHVPAPALVSQISAMDDGHNIRDSESVSMQTGDGSIEDQDLVSRFLSNSHHASIGSQGTGSVGTPKIYGSYNSTGEHIPRRNKPPPSPGSNASVSTTPNVGRSRIELRLLGEKALADREAAAERAPQVPHHVYDRRNETLKSYLNIANPATTNGSVDNRGTGGLATSSISFTSASLGPETFQGRFKAISTELKVVQRYRDPVVESFDRMRAEKNTVVGAKFSANSAPSNTQNQSGLKVSKSAVSLLPAALSGAAAERQQQTAQASPPPSTPSGGGSIRMPKRDSTNASPQKTGDVISSVKSSGALHRPSASFNVPASATSQQQIRRPNVRRGVSFAGTPPETRERREPGSGADNGGGADLVARMMWEEVA